MQILKSQPSGERIMPETQITLFPALFVYPQVWFSRSVSETDVRLYLSDCGLNKTDQQLFTTDMNTKTKASLRNFVKRNAV